MNYRKFSLILNLEDLLNKYSVEFLSNPVKRYCVLKSLIYDYSNMCNMCKGRVYDSICACSDIDFMRNIV